MNRNHTAQHSTAQESIKHTQKIVYIYNNLVLGGAERVLVNTLQQLSQNSRYDIHLILIGDQDLGHFILPKNITIHHILSRYEAEFDIVCKQLLRENALPTWNNYLHYWINRFANEKRERINQHFQTHHYDLIISFEDHLEDFLKHNDLDIPIIRWVHVSWYLDHWLNNPEYFRPILSKYEMIVPISQEMEQLTASALTTLGLQQKLSSAVYNILDFKHIIEQSNQLDEKFQPYLNSPYILQVSRLNAVKNHIEMLEIYAALKQKGIKEKLYIVGSGVEQKRLEEKIKSLGLENDCLLLGATNNPYALMKHARLFIHTSIAEGFCSVLLESMICGTPVVAMHCPGVREILGDGKYGELIPLHNQEQFVERCYELLTNEEKYQQYVNLLPEATARFDFPLIEQQLISLFDKVIEQYSTHK